jgi:hypothetical protein
MKMNMLKANIIYFTHKPNSIIFNYYVGGVLIVTTYYVKDLGVRLDSKLHFHCHVQYLYSHILKLIYFIT